MAAATNSAAASGSPELSGGARTDADTVTRSRIDLTFTQDSSSDPIRIGKVIPHQGKRYVVRDIEVVGYKGWVLIDGETEFREAVVWVEPVE